MAALADTAVVVERAWFEGGLQHKDYVAKHVTLTLTAQGTSANSIDAATLGFALIIDAQEFVKSDNSVGVRAVPNYDGSKLLLLNQSTGAPADQTGTFRGVVRGVPTATY